MGGVKGRWLTVRDEEAGSGVMMMMSSLSDGEPFYSVDSVFNVSPATD